ncbi:cell surface protein [Lampropedia aestuarii]|uniref:Cell surface protein n=1 Tax=Lampropedia aestuarii TaxID=2562762 RepID=A0A4S5BLW0_9BURK|nr:cell surface protein [Lampropedia aestuarii]THJ31771.1 cell surface protein [Lampropedia aestuarii]
MKKNVFALSVAAALAVLAGSASAQSVSAVPGANQVAATEFAINAGGVGHIQLVPYYTVQNSNNTLLNVVNTDTVNGKAVKVRFRGARNSDDVFDFYLLLSPGDVWRSRVYKDEAGNTRLDLNGDTTCTYPNNEVVQSTAFPVGRVFDNLVSETREGYVEILTAADIPPNSDKESLYTAIKHVNGVAPCYSKTEAINDAFATPLTTAGEVTAAGFGFPTTGLIANWAVMDVATGSTASGNATALQAVDTNGVAGVGNFVVAPQNAVAVSAAWITDGTADPLFTGADPAIEAAYYDFPDLSTPYLTGANTPSDQANHVSAALAVSEIINEFTTGEAGFKTDWVFSLPTRRYGVAIDYAAEDSRGNVVGDIVFNDDSDYFAPANSKLNRANGIPSVQITLNGTYWDKEEGMSAVDNGAVISPSTPAGLPYISGEVNVFTFNGNAPDSILGGTIAYNNIAPQVKGAAVESGWAKFKLAAANGTGGTKGTGLPVIGFATMTAGNGINLTYAHRFNK